MPQDHKKRDSRRAERAAFLTSQFAERQADAEPAHAVCRGWSHAFTEVAAIIDHNERGLPNTAVADAATGRIVNKQIGSRLPVGAPTMETIRRRTLMGIPLGSVGGNDPAGWRGH